jgi:hypothetical protein
MKINAGAAFAGLRSIIPLGKANGFAVRLMAHLLGAAAREALKLLLAIAPVSWQVLQACAFDHQRLSPSLLQILVSLWPLLHAMLGAA